MSARYEKPEVNVIHIEQRSIICSSWEEIPIEEDDAQWEEILIEGDAEYGG